MFLEILTFYTLIASLTFTELDIPPSIIENCGTNIDQIKLAESQLSADEKKYFIWMLKHMPQRDLKVL